VRTRDGCKDVSIPANKVLFIKDGLDGFNYTFKPEDFVSEFDVLLADTDPTPPTRRPVQIIQYVPRVVGKVQGVLMGKFANFTGSPPPNVEELEFFSGVVFEGTMLEVGHKVMVHAATAAHRPSNDFYVALIIKCMHNKQMRYNALIFCAEDDAMVQVGMSSVLKVDPEETADAHVLAKIGQALLGGSVKLTDPKSAQQKGVRATKAVQKAAHEKAAQERASKLSEKAAQKAAVEHRNITSLVTKLVTSIRGSNALLA
jgi:hypothetical protein